MRNIKYIYSVAALVCLLFMAGCGKEKKENKRADNSLNYEIIIDADAAAMYSSIMKSWGDRIHYSKLLKGPYIEDTRNSHQETFVAKDTVKIPGAREWGFVLKRDEKESGISFFIRKDVNTVEYVDFMVRTVEDAELMITGESDEAVITRSVSEDKWEAKKIYDPILLKKDAINRFEELLSAVDRIAQQTVFRN